MIEVPLGSSYRFEISVSYDGEPSSPDGAISVDVFSESGDSIISDIMQQDIYDTSKFYYIMLGEVTATEQDIKVVSSYEIDGVEYVETRFVRVSQPYVTVEEIVAELGYSLEPQDPRYVSERDLVLAERLARLQINYTTGRKFGLYSGTQEAYGLDSDTLMFPERMVSFSKLEQNGEVVYDSDNGINLIGYALSLTPTGQGVRASYAEDLEFIYAPPQSTWQSPRFRFKSGNLYKVYCNMGWSAVPFDIKQAALILVSDNMHRDAGWRERYISKFSTGQIQMEFRDEAFAGTGNLIVDRLLAPYKMSGMRVI